MPLSMKRCTHFCKCHACFKLSLLSFEKSYAAEGNKTKKTLFLESTEADAIIFAQALETKLMEMHKNKYVTMMDPSQLLLMFHVTSTSSKSQNDVGLN
jgi:hypothetical protein